MRIRIRTPGSPANKRESESEPNSSPTIQRTIRQRFAFCTKSSSLQLNPYVTGIYSKTPLCSLTMQKYPSRAYDHNEKVHVRVEQCHVAQTGKTIQHGMLIYLGQNSKVNARSVNSILRQSTYQIARFMALVNATTQ